MGRVLLIHWVIRHCSKQVQTPMSARAQSNPAIAYFLLSDESFPITGEVVRVDAGWAVIG